MGGLVGLPLRLGGLERAAGTPRDQGLLALLVARLGHLLDRLRVPDLRTSAPGSVVSPAAAAAADCHRPQCRPTQARPRRAARGRAVLRTAPSASRLPHAVSVSFAITML